MTEKNCNVYDVTVQQIGDCKVEVDGLHYDVTLARTGSCTVVAEDSYKAMAMVNDMPSSELSGAVTWCDDGVCVTDACCTDETFDEVNAMDAVADICFDADEIVWDNISALDADEEE